MIDILTLQYINQDNVGTESVVLLAAVQILDAQIVMTRRVEHKKGPFKADITHIHHIILSQREKNVEKTTLILLLLQSIFTYIGLGFKVRDDIYILGAFVMLFVLFYLLLSVKR